MKLSLRQNLKLIQDNKLTRIQALNLFDYYFKEEISQVEKILDAILETNLLPTSIEFKGIKEFNHNKLYRKKIKKIINITNYN